VHRLGASLEDRGRVAMLGDDAPRGLVYLTEARRLGTSDAASDLLVARALESIDSESALIAHQPAGFFIAQFDAMSVVALDTASTVQTWDRATRARTSAPIQGIAAATPLGDRVAMVDEHGAVQVVGRDGSARWRVVSAHADFVNDVRFPNGVAGNATGNVVVSWGPTAKLWSGEDGHLRGEIAMPGPVLAAAFDHDGTRVAVADIAGTVRIWDAASAALVATCPAHDGRVRALAWTGDGAQVVSGGDDGKVVLCDARSGALVHRFEGHAAPVIALDVSKDGTRIASAGFDGPVRVWNRATGLETARLEGHTVPVTSVQFSPDGASLATAGLDSIVRIWDVDSGTLAGTLQGGGVTSMVGWEADGSALITAGMDGTIRRWDVARARRGREVKLHAGLLRDLSLSPDGRTLASAADDGLVISDARTREVRAALRDLGPITNARFAPDSRTLVVTTGGGSAAIYGVDGIRSSVLPGTGYTTATITTGGVTVTVGHDMQLRMWSPRGDELAHLQLEFEPADLVLDPSGRYVVAVPGYGNTREAAAPVLDVERHEIVARLRGEHAPYTVAMSQTQIAASDGNDIRVWDLGTWRPVATLVGHRAAVTALGFLADGRLISSGSDFVSMVWRDGKLVSTLPGGSARLTAFASAPDGATFASATGDGLVHVWDAATYQPLFTQRAHALAATHLVYGTDGQSILSGGADGRVASWNLPHPHRSLAELDEILRCRVPLRLEHDTLLPRALDFDDASCR